MEHPGYIEQGEEEYGAGGVEYDEGGYDYTDSTEEAVQLGREIAGYHQQQEQVEQMVQEAEDAAEWNQLMRDYPELENEQSAAPVADRVRERAREHYEAGEVPHPDVLTTDPQFARKVYEEDFNGGLSESDARFVRMARERTPNNISWD